ncbi:MAG: phytanoyl-CoA dioxygenase family protein [Candidatus Binatia bacterium]|nr:phytanoyl-CoA dioxygenase family protein [Candidatus Binatia bacterium]
MAAVATNRFTVPIGAEDESLADRVREDGFAIVEGVLERNRCADLIAEVDRVEREHGIEFGTNDFEGFRTRRIFNLIHRSPLFRELVIHEPMLALMERLLGVDFLLSGTTSMHISPGETEQLLHSDDGMITLPRPHVPTLITTLWALSDFAGENGATRIVPGSNQRENMPKPGEEHESIAAEMPAGSVVVLHGSTWHGGGANGTTDTERYGLSIQFVSGWCRQQQNLMLGTDRETAATYPRRLQELIGYSLYLNVMGHVDRAHPLTLLGIDQAPNMVWEKMGKDQ